MHVIRRTSTVAQRKHPVRWARRAEVQPTWVESVPKHKEDVMDTLADLEPRDRTSLSATSVSTRVTVAADAWMDCAAALKDYDAAKIESWEKEIDTHLVFAGLFSAILTAFNVEAYKLLQPQDSDATNVLLATLVMTMAQANNMPIPTVASEALNGSSGSNGRSRPSAVLINVLWFCSLICSLAAASISILVKQWLNEYTSGLASVSPEIARVRQFRYDNLRRWRVPEIMMLLPILLQGAVVLFLIGLIEFLAPLATTVTAIASILIGALLAFILITAILPTFVSHCSYQSPQAWGVFVIFQALKKPIRSVARFLTAYASSLAVSHADGTLHRLRARLAKRLVQRLLNFANKPNTYSWKARERILLQEEGAILDQHLLVGADRTFLDDTFLRDVVSPCLNDMPPAAAMQCYYEIMAHRADRVVNGVPSFNNRRGSTGTQTESLAILTDITLDVLQKTRAIRILRTLEPLLVRTLPLTYPHFCRVFLSLLDDPDLTFRHLAFSIMYQHLSRNLELAAQHACRGCHDFNAIVAFINNARTDPETDVKSFLDACDLVVCLATTLPSSVTEGSQIREHLRDTLLHLQNFFSTPLWKNEARLLYPISRIAPHLVALERRYLGILEDQLLDVLGEVAQHAGVLNIDHGRNWEDKLIVLEEALEDLRTLRLQGHQQGGSSRSMQSSSTLNEERPPQTRRPSLMRNALVLDV